MSDKGFLVGEFELKCFMQECLHLFFDLFRFFFRADESKEPIICVPYTFESSVVGVVEVY